MADLRNHELEHQIGLNSDTADRTATSVAPVWVPVDPGGVQMEGAPEITDVPTEHGTKGIKYAVLTSRNAQQGSVSMPFFPERASLLNAPVTLSSGGVPRYMTVNTYDFSNLAVTASGNSSADLGERKVVMFSTLSMAIDRNAPAPLALQLGGYVNTDRRIAYAATTSADTETAGAVTFTCADASGFKVGDYVTVVDTDNATTDSDVIITAISGNNISCTTTEDLDGSGTALTITKVVPTATWPTLDPYSSAETSVDFEVASTAGAFNAEWGGDNADLTALSVDFNAQITVKGFTADGTDNDENLTWTRATDGVPECSGAATLILAEDAYLDYKRAPSVRKCRFRVMGYTRSGASFTSTGAGSAGTSVVITTASTTGFAVNDYVYLTDGTKQAVAKITALSADTSITLDTLDADIGSGASVYNTGWEIKVDEADITGATKAPDGDNYAITVNYSARVKDGLETILATKAYDDDAA